MNHTPGPWQRFGVRYKAITEDKLDCLQVGPDGFAIALVPIGRTHEEHAMAMRDAALIAAAPELLKALRTLRDSLDPTEDWIGEQTMHDFIDAAIAKATGAA